MYMYTACVSGSGRTQRIFTAHSCELSIFESDSQLFQYNNNSDIQSSTQNALNNRRVVQSQI